MKKIIFLLFIKISPLSGCKIPVKRLTKVLLPDPLSPKIPIVSPKLISKFKLENIFLFEL